MTKKSVSQSHLPPPQPPVAYCMLLKATSGFLPQDLCTGCALHKAQSPFTQALTTQPSGLLGDAFPACPKWLFGSRIKDLKEVVLD